jgi:hypothetical protein
VRAYCDVRPQVVMISSAGEAPRRRVGLENGLESVQRAACRPCASRVVAAAALRCACLRAAPCPGSSPRPAGP